MIQSMVKFRTFFRVLLILHPLICFLSSASAQTIPFPGTGYYNTNLSQTNIVECDNGNEAAVQMRLLLRARSGAVLVQFPFVINAFGSRHITLNELANIVDQYGSYTLELLSSSSLAARISCRTAFYRFTHAFAPKQFDFAYVLPVRASLTGDVGGLYNSFNSFGPSPALNWLSVVNNSDSEFNAVLDIHSYEGSVESSFPLPPLAPYERRDFGLGHPQGQRAGVYRLRPANPSQPYDAFLVRYTADSQGFASAFPLRALPAVCSETPVQISTMGNGLTQNWLELFNLSSIAESVLLTLKNRNGSILRQELVSLAPFGQKHVFVNPYLDPTAAGNLGSASITCPRDSRVMIQSAFYGRLPGVSRTEWAYAVQGGIQAAATSIEQLAVPVNTFLGMANWFKGVNPGTNALTMNFTVINQTGNALIADERPVFAGGTVDIGAHESAGPDFTGTLLASPESGTLAGEMLRVLPRRDGQIGYIMHIPASSQPKSQWPEPPQGYFPQGSVWYQDISAAPLDSQSSAVIQWLQNAGGWGTGIMRIDFSIEVLDAAPTAPFRTFTRTSDFYSPDCDHVPVPVPVGGVIEGENGYQCASDGDCHLIVSHKATGKLYEMWRANIVGGSNGVGGTFFGGCLAVWDMTKVYGPSGRGENCTSADAAGYPIAPLLFTADEVASGSINHAIRFILPNSRIRNGVYLHPSTHSTSAASGGPNAPPYGTRLRLRPDFPLNTLPNEAARVVARAMQKYGILLSDGGSIALTAQSDRYNTAKWENLLGPRDLQLLQVSDFQMVNGGARIPYTGDCVRNP